MRRLSFLAPLLVLAGCAETPPAEVDPDLGKADGDGVSVGTLEHTAAGVGILGLLNEPSTDVALLDERLDRRAAENLIAHRDGPDGVFEEGARGSDDDPFDRVAEVDDVYWVGYAALRALRDLAFELDFVPGPNGLLGEYDGVPFTVEEAERALYHANYLSEDELRAIGLNATMIESLVEARPIPNIGVLAELFFIGPATLEKLRDHGRAGPGGEACESHADCGELSCVGVPSEGFPLTGVCRDTGPIDGQGEMCLADADCASGLFCSALTIFDEGFCRPEWMRTTVEYGGVASIPSVPMTWPTAHVVRVTGLASVPEDIVVDAGFEHTAPRALRITLIDPNGAEAILWDGPDEPSDAVFDPRWSAGWAISRDDEVNGDWQLTVQNVTGEGEGRLDGFSLTVSSRWD
ncbi:MAG TPA: proprotein convertase P-domain-containing protein [Sandaracinaceae bacterium LLY-WYZ-13_1]|nr:proprotein convertase P-domain-containing protein [Sandaracinaceae bacterium LLY-WYZ-13_1]